jgi:hypothetical protein
MLPPGGRNWQLIFLIIDFIMFNVILLFYITSLFTVMYISVIVIYSFVYKRLVLVTNLRFYPSVIFACKGWSPPQG